MSVSRVDDTDSEALRAALGDARSVLVLAPNGALQPCATLFSQEDPADVNLLYVSLDGSPDARLDELRAELGELPAETGVIAVGETTRSAATTALSAGGPGPSPISIDTVADPSDLTGLAMAIGTYLDAWSASEKHPKVCFDSITSLLFHAEEERVFRFLHATSGRLRDVGAAVHYHLNPIAYDESTINAFSALFDAVVRVEDDGTVTVSKRR